MSAARSGAASRPDTLVVVNPASRGGRTRHAWPNVEARLRAALGPMRVAFTTGRRHAERIAGEAVRDGTRRILVAGGDGTASEVAAGVVAAGLGEVVTLGLIPMGTGRDLARALGFHGDVDTAVSVIAGGTSRRVDMGRVTDTTTGAIRYFLNIASAGLTAEVVADLARGDEGASRGVLSYAATGLRALLGWPNPRATVSVDGRVVHDGPLVFAAAANGRYFGGGMLVAPRAELDDGLLDVVIVRGLSRAKLLLHCPRVYTGSHLDHPAVVWTRGRQVEVVAKERLWVEGDGELLFPTPARIDVMPGAVALFVR